MNFIAQFCFTNTQGKWVEDVSQRYIIIPPDSPTNTHISAEIDNWAFQEVSKIQADVPESAYILLMGELQYDTNPFGWSFVVRPIGSSVTRIPLKS